MTLTLALPPHVRASVATTPIEALLSADERVRRDSFASADRRAAFSLGRTAARTLLAEAHSLEARLVQIGIGDDGAPTVSGSVLSIAHTGQGAHALGVAAVSDRPVGIDAEAVAPRRPDLWRRILTPEEWGVIEALGGPTDDTQTLVWALKESVLKGQRTGFRAGARSVVLALDGAPGRARAVSEASGAWEIAYARLGNAWVAVAYAA